MALATGRVDGSQNKWQRGRYHTYWQRGELAAVWDLDRLFGLSPLRGGAIREVSDQSGQRGVARKGRLWHVST